jgi:hypothetical protein
MGGVLALWVLEGRRAAAPMKEDARSRTGCEGPVSA